MSVSVFSSIRIQWSEVLAYVKASGCGVLAEHFVIYHHLSESNVPATAHSDNRHAERDVIFEPFDVVGHLVADIYMEGYCTAGTEYNVGGFVLLVIVVWGSLKNNENHLERYNDIFNKQIRSNILKEVYDNDIPPNSRVHYMPHQAVLTPNKQQPNSE
ncbi:hypothetical protein KIN20_016023 [Parelaphostrongylus tenuis]|uniref:Uncharacterized protein n=1 Tax=Parelaphostrongylus tenuis TaxID=148309 RepID=A0AAD5QSV6_PARTN|nr:hypothetical protein KIN20_016023 [Parelaphostrongylus tenuis]